MLTKRKLEYRIPTPQEWGQICSIPWSKTERRAIAKLFAENGHDYLEFVVGSNWPLTWRLNQKLKKNGLLWRLRVKIVAPETTRHLVILYKQVQ